MSLPMIIHPDTADAATIVDRLRGTYRLPILDGLGPAGGDEPENASEFVRTFTAPPIQHAAAAEIERLREDKASLLAALKKLDASWTQDFEDGPDGDRKWCGGLGTLSDETADLWREIRSAIAKATGA